MNGLAVLAALAMGLLIADVILLFACMKAGKRADEWAECLARESVHVDEEQIRLEADMLHEAMKEENW